MLVAPAPPAGVPGLTSDTWHPWRVGTGSWSIATAALSLNAGPGTAFCAVRNGVNGGESRTITTLISTGSTPALTVWAHVPTDGAHGGSAIKASITGGTVSLVVNAVTRATAPAASVPANSTHTVTLAITVAYGLPSRARIAVDGVQLIDYRLTAAEGAIFAPGTTVFPYLEDGVGSISDATSVFESFVVAPLADDSSPPMTAQSATYTALVGEITRCTANTFTLTLPPPIATAPPTVIANTGSGVITVHPPSGTLTNLSGAAGDITLTQGQAARIANDGTDYFQIA